MTDKRKGIREYDNRKIRMHDGLLHLNIIEKPHGWVKELFRKLGSSAKEQRRKHGYSYQIGEHLLIIYSASMMKIRSPWIEDKNVSIEGYDNCVRRFKVIQNALKERLERNIPGLKLNPRRPFKITSMEVAITNSAFAKFQYQEFNRPYNQYGIFTDKSHKKKELETKRLNRQRVIFLKMLDMEDKVKPLRRHRLYKNGRR